MSTTAQTSSSPLSSAAACARSRATRLPASRSERLVVSPAAMRRTRAAPLPPANSGGKGRDPRRHQALGPDDPGHRRPQQPPRPPVADQRVEPRQVRRQQPPLPRRQLHPAPPPPRRGHFTVTTSYARMSGKNRLLRFPARPLSWKPPLTT